MSFQGYLNTIRDRTGLGPDDFVRLAGERGLLDVAIRPGDVISWLAADHGLGRGHAMAIVAVLKEALPISVTGATSDSVATLFSGPRTVWAPTYEALLKHVQGLGNDTGIAPTTKYVGFTRGGRKFAIVAPTGDRLDLGLRLDPGLVDPALEPSGSWNSMVTHRARITEPGQLTGGLLALLDSAYSGRGAV
ncbi:DUF4287 domain-containing protein [Parafrankia sp. EUN1f]|uniref:DUF4287 domain-containing protein n=1 Tax=Parafrankia sp. EUN1f TaxID=102897 RepID=UPI0001C4427F|nr:DUF4287 domain-containing protein [Parafrankia sp. EUN1f]EFC85358.1 hypothetical protein FrEUN1fDRAFT_1505 [Parafrankia sp. EUN1f]